MRIPPDHLSQKIRPVHPGQDLIGHHDRERTLFLEDLQALLGGRRSIRIANVRNLNLDILQNLVLIIHEQHLG